MSLVGKNFVIVGLNEQNKAIIASIEKEQSNLTILFDKKEECINFECDDKVTLLHFTAKDDLGDVIAKHFNGFENKSVNVIINSGNESQNLIYLEQISKMICSYDLCKYAIDERRGLHVFVFAEPENAETVFTFVEQTKGCVNYINKYRQIAIDFVNKFPITEFMTTKQIDYSTATIKKDVALNVVLIGFDKTNQHIFLTSVANNQCLTKTQSEYAEKPINYWIYAGKSEINNQCLSNNYFRYANVFKPNEEDYLPLPPRPAIERFFELNTSDSALFQSIKENLTVSSGANLYGYVIVSSGTDLENIDFSKKLVAKLKQWGLFEQVKVFARIKASILSAHKAETKDADEGYIPFGNENEVVYNINHIVEGQKEQMAKDRFLCYALAGHSPNKSEYLEKANALRKWYEQAPVQRASNLYACLSIRMKLHLLGFDYKESDDNPDCAADFLRQYQAGDTIVYDEAKAAVQGRKIIAYSNEIKKDTIRYTMAVQEHQRWNAYMISSGYLPIALSQIANGSVKDTTLKLHGNITTFEGLVRYREIIATVKNISEDSADVIRYDYQIMDDVVWLLTKNGYQIVKR